MNTTDTQLSTHDASISMNMIPTYILGAGSLGLAWAASLRLAFPHYPVALLLKPKPKPKPKQSKHKNNVTSMLTIGYQRKEVSSSQTQTSKADRWSPPRLVHVPARTMMMVQQQCPVVQVVQRLDSEFELFEAARVGDDALVSVSSSPATNTNTNNTAAAADRDPSSASTEQEEKEKEKEKEEPPVMMTALVVTIKAYDAVAAVEQWVHDPHNQQKYILPNDDCDDSDGTTRRRRRRQKQNIRLVLLCNGALAVQDDLLLSWKKQEPRRLSSCFDRIVLALTTHGAYQPTPPHPSPKPILSSRSKAATSTINDDHNNNNDDDDDDTAVDDVKDEEELSFRSVVHVGGGAETTSNSTTLVHDWPVLAQIWTRAGLHCTSVSSQTEMHARLWQKLAVNCVINPLTALRQCTNGQLLRELLRVRDDKWPQEQEPPPSHSTTVPPLRDIVHGVVEEVVRVANAYLQHHEENNEDDHSLSWDLSVQSTMDFIDQVLHETQENRSSMLQDVLRWQHQQHTKHTKHHYHHSPVLFRTEINELNGYVVRQGRLHNIPCPYNEHLWTQVTNLEKTLNSQ